MTPRPTIDRWLCALALTLTASGAVQAAQTAPADSTAPTTGSAAGAPTAAEAAQTTPTTANGFHRNDLGRLPSAGDLRPNSPVTIRAHRADLVQGNIAIYSGDVTLESDTLKMDGDRVEVRKQADGQYQARIDGNPGHLSHAGTGPDNPPVSAHARTLNYDTRSGIVDLIGNAYFKRGSDEISGDTIRYNVIERRLEAAGGDGGQVRVVIQPAPTPVSPPAQTPTAPAGRLPTDSSGTAPPTGSEPSP